MLDLRSVVIGLGALLMPETVQTVRADDFVLGGEPTANLTVCRDAAAKGDTSHIRLFCNSAAFLFNRDTSEVYVCYANLVFGIEAKHWGGDRSQIKPTEDIISVTCAKQAKVFEGESKYVFFGKTDFGASPFENRQHAWGNEAWGNVIWVADKNALRVKACFQLALRQRGADNRFECADATFASDP
jgi:hypothetical protein